MISIAEAHKYVQQQKMEHKSVCSDELIRARIREHQSETVATKLWNRTPHGLEEPQGPAASSGWIS